MDWILISALLIELWPYACVRQHYSIAHALPFDVFEYIVYFNGFPPYWKRVIYPKRLFSETFLTLLDVYVTLQYQSHQLFNCKCHASPTNFPFTICFILPLNTVITSANLPSFWVQGNIRIYFGTAQKSLQETTISSGNKYIAPIHPI